MPIIELPSALRPRGAARRAKVTVEGSTVAEALESLCRLHPELRAHLFGHTGVLKRSIGVFVGEEDVRADGGLERAIGAETHVLLVTAMAGG